MGVDPVDELGVTPRDHTGAGVVKVGWGFPLHEVGGEGWELLSDGGLKQLLALGG